MLKALVILKGTSVLPKLQTIYSVFVALCVDVSKVPTVLYLLQKHACAVLAISGYIALWLKQLAQLEIISARSMKLYLIRFCHIAEMEVDY